MKRLAHRSNVIVFSLLSEFDHWRQTTRRPASDVSFLEETNYLHKKNQRCCLSLAFVCLEKLQLL